MNAQSEAKLVNMMNELPHAWYNQAVELARKGEFEKARDCLLTTLSLDPGMIDAHVVLGKVYAQIEEYEKAAGSLEAALVLDPENKAAQSGLKKARELREAIERRQARGKLLSKGLGVALFILGIAAFQGYRSVSSMMTPPPVETVRSALLAHPALVGSTLQVAEKDKGLQISGTVDTEERKTLVCVLAESKAGGSPLDISGLRVEKSGTKAESIRLLERVSAALLNHPALSGTRLSVQGADRAIQVTGKVSTPAQKIIVAAVAEGKAGEILVDVSQVMVAHPSPLAESFSRLLNHFEKEKLGSIEVQERNGRLYLAGTVASGSGKQRLEDLARILVGIEGVDTTALTTLGASEYVFQQGDNLWDLAVRFYGDGREWVAIEKENQHLPRDHRKIPTGTRIAVFPR